MLCYGLVLLVKYTQCGFEHPSEIKVNKKSVQTAGLPNNVERCLIVLISLHTADRIIIFNNPCYIVIYFLYF